MRGSLHPKSGLAMTAVKRSSAACEAPPFRQPPGATLPDERSRLAFRDQCPDARRLLLVARRFQRARFGLVGLNISRVDFARGMKLRRGLARLARASYNRSPDKSVTPPLGDRVPPPSGNTPSPGHSCRAGNRRSPGLCRRGCSQAPPGVPDCNHLMASCVRPWMLATWPSSTLHSAVIPGSGRSLA